MNVIVAVSENMVIGINGDLPGTLPNPGHSQVLKSAGQHVRRCGPREVSCLLVLRHFHYVTPHYVTPLLTSPVSFISITSHPQRSFEEMKISSISL